MSVPVVVLEELVPLVTAKPDKVTKPEDGFITRVDIVDNPKPVPEAEFTAVIENCEFTAVGATATEVAAAAGTACHVGTELAPVEVRTNPVLELAANLAKDVPVDATSKSPTA